MVTALPRPLSEGEELFALHCRIYKLSPVREFQFALDRKWRLDFAWPAKKVAVEIESSVHRIRNRFKSDIDKYNRLAREGWVLLRYTRQMVESGTAIDEVTEALSGRA